MRLLRLEPETGRKISETILDERDPKTGQNLQVHVKGLNMPAALTDILSSDGKYVYMRTQRFDLSGIRSHIVQTEVADQLGEGRHLFCSTGMLDGSWLHRSYWIFGKSIASGAGGWPRAGKVTPAGRLLVIDDYNVYGYGRKYEYYKWTAPMEYHFFAADKDPQRLKPPAPKPAKTRAERRRQQKQRARAPATKPVYHWSKEVPIYVRALVLANKTLFIAGPTDIIDEEEIFKNLCDPIIDKKLREQTDIFEGKKGSLLHVVSALDGKNRRQYSLESPPVWDGMAAANGRLYISMKNDKYCVWKETNTLSKII
jgi:hypothetical protein